MIAEIHYSTITKRSLKKLRAQFLHKKEDSDEERQVDTATKYLNVNNTYVLLPTLGLVEMNRKIGAGPQNANIYFIITDSTIEANANRSVTLHIEENRHMAGIPWEYSTKRLESYGDLELATLAHRIKKFHANMNTVVSQYEEAMRKNDGNLSRVWDGTITKARKACEELEKNEVFYKAMYHFSKSSTTAVASIYSEGLLRAMGFTPKNFIKWTQRNGMPTVFDPECSVFQHCVKMFFDLTLFQENSICQSLEYETYLYDSTGSKIKTLVTAHYVLEPVADGFLSHCYFVAKDIEPSSYIRKTKYKEFLEEDMKKRDMVSEPKFEEDTDI